MNGQSYRKLAVSYVNVILPSVAFERREAFSSLFHNWLEIQALMYDFGNLKVNDFEVMEGVKLRMHICAFLHLHMVFFNLIIFFKNYLLNIFKLSNYNVNNVRSNFSMVKKLMIFIFIL